MGLQRGKVWATKRIFPSSFFQWERWSVVKASATFKIAANARCETKSKGPAGAGGCRGAACWRSGQRKAKAWGPYVKFSP